MKHTILSISGDNLLQALKLAVAASFAAYKDKLAGFSSVQLEHHLRERFMDFEQNLPVAELRQLAIGDHEDTVFPLTKPLSTPHVLWAFCEELMRNYWITVGPTTAPRSFKNQPLERVWAATDRYQTVYGASAAEAVVRLYLATIFGAEVELPETNSEVSA